MRQYRSNPGDITRLYTRSKNSQMIPLSAMVTTHYTAGPSIIPHFNGFPSAQVTGKAAQGTAPAMRSLPWKKRSGIPAGRLRLCMVRHGAPREGVGRQFCRGLHFWRPHRLSSSLQHSMNPGRSSFCHDSRAFRHHWCAAGHLSERT